MEIDRGGISVKMFLTFLRIFAIFEIYNDWNWLFLIWDIGKNELNLIRKKLLKSRHLKKLKNKKNSLWVDISFLTSTMVGRILFNYSANKIHLDLFLYSYFFTQFIVAPFFN